MAGYYHQEDLAHFSDMGKNAPDLWNKFSEWYGAVFAEGALTEREKCLIALGVAHACSAPTASTPIRRPAWRKAPIWSR